MNIKTLAFVFFSGLLLIALNACSPYPDGPVISLQSPEARLTQSWEVLNATDKEGNDVSSSYENEFVFMEDGEVEARIEILNIKGDYEGTWDLDNDDTEFELDLQDRTTGIIQFKRSYDILRLTSEDFWLRDQSDSTVIQMELN